jgi:hypothetical protein
MVKSIIFYTPFGTHTTRSYPDLADEWVRRAPHVPLTSLARSESLIYTPGRYDHRGCLWWDGAEAGSLFQAEVRESDFVPRAKGRLSGVDPFVIAGFATHTRRFDRFIPLDIPVWKGRELANVPYKDRERVLRLTLADLVSREPPWFLSEERIQWPVFHPFPLDTEKRRRLQETNYDLFLTDRHHPEWRYWCVYWLE